LTVKIECETAAEDDKRKCLYENVVLSHMDLILNLDNGDRQSKAKFVNLLVSISAQNCGRFLSRMSANRQGLDFWQRFLGSLSSTASGATAFATPFAAVGISSASQIVTSGMGAAGATYYSSTQSALETAIRSNMLADEAVIQSRLNGSASYPVMAAIADVGELDRDCSLDRGLEFVAAATQSQAQGGGVARGTLAPSLALVPELAVVWDQKADETLTLADEFAGSLGASRTYTAAMSDGSTRPDWIAFDAKTLVVSKTAKTPSGPGSWIIRITAEDDKHQTASELFKIEVK
jgi:hypothetical protein